MDDRIKSAFEKAMERAGSMGEVSAEELSKAENMPKGRMMAARFLADADYDLAGALAGEDPGVRPYIGEGARETLLLNIVLPQDGQALPGNRLAMSGLAVIGQDRGALAEALGEMEYLFDYYGKIVESTYQRFKDSFGQRRFPKQAGRRMDPGMGANVEKTSAFLEEWSRVRVQLEEQFEEKLRELKNKIRQIG